MKNQVTAELGQARTAAAAWYLDTYGGGAASDAISVIVDDPLLEPATALLASFLDAARYDDPTTSRPGWPLGTAQLVDVYRQLALQLPTAGADELQRALDLALADRVIPQASNLLTTQLDAIEAWLEAQTAMPRTIEALQHLRAGSSTVY